MASPARVLARIDDELRALWSSPAATGEPLKSRACTMNLVIVASSVDRSTRWVPIVDDVIQSVPARAIVVGLDPDGPDDLQASVSAVCTPDVGHGTVVCSERVTLVAGGAVTRRLPSCVDAICATDVPMTLVWLAPADTDDPAFLALASEASRIVLDAAQTSLASVARVVRWSRRRPRTEGPGIADLAWTRLASWQELCARMFDPPALRGLAQHLTSVDVVHAADPGARVSPEAALLVGWLATRLEWTRASGTNAPGPLRPDGATVQVRFRERKDERRPPGAVLELVLEAATDGMKLRGSIVRPPGAESDMTTWRVDVVAGGEARTLEQRLSLWTDQPARVLERTLHRRLRDEALCDAALWADEPGPLSSAVGTG